MIVVASMLTRQPLPFVRLPPPLQLETRLPNTAPPLRSGTSLRKRELFVHPSTPWRAAVALDAKLLQTAAVGNVVVQDILAFLLSFVGSFVWVQLFGLMSKRDLFSRKISRKLIHITTAPMCLIFWSTFSPAPEARYMAALVPLFNVFRVIASGLEIVRDKSFVQSMSREGSSSEMLTGPLFYVLTLLFVTVYFWRSSVASSLVVGIMCGGDGMADIVGRRFGKHNLPYNPNKSFEGSAAFIVFGTLLGLGLVAFFCMVGLVGLEGHVGRLAIQFLSITTVCAFLESLPITNKIDDNIIVPTAAVLMGIYTLGGA